MSALTKLFIVLLIICSLLLTAATVVFINRTEDWKAVVQVKDESLAREKKNLEQLNIQLQSAQTNAAKLASDLNNSKAEASKEADGLRGQIKDKDNLLNKQEVQIAMNQATISSANEALKAAQKNVEDVQARNTSLTQENDKLRSTNAELVSGNTDLQKKLEASDRDVRWLAEQVNQLKSDVSRAQELLVAHRIPLTAPRAPRRVDVKGAVKEVSVKDGIAFASITLGAADKIEKGMQLFVVDSDAKQFLGKITVDTVDQNEAVGRLEGPRVGEIKENCQVLSQL